MPIPFIIGGVIAAVAATAATVAVVSQSSSGSSSSDGVNEEALRLEKEKEVKDLNARKGLLAKYSRQVAKNLAEKYGSSDSAVLEKGLIRSLRFSGKRAHMSSILGHIPGPDIDELSVARGVLGVPILGKIKPVDLLLHTAHFTEKQQTVSDL